MSSFKWTEGDQEAAFEALSGMWPDDSTHEEERNDDCYNAAGAVLRSATQRVSGERRRLLDELEAEAREHPGHDGWIDAFIAERRVS